MDYLKLSQKFFCKHSKYTYEKSISLNKESIHEFIHNIIKILFPISYKFIFNDQIQLATAIKKEEIRLLEILLQIVDDDKAQKITKNFFNQLEQIHDLLELDAESILKGDPATNDIYEVITCYPGLWAISVYRIAHFFYTEEIPIFPRFLSEYAHQITGIDIHPGAQIGKSFSIDHGTGAVIGETTIIGNDVKIYQGVTLGALSPEKSMNGIKRHPTVEDKCIIYSNATILGGETTIGSNSIIGGNVWITKSIPANSLVYHRNEIKIINKKK